MENLVTWKYPPLPTCTQTGSLLPRVRRWNLAPLYFVNDVFLFVYFSHTFHFLAFGQAVVTGVDPSPPKFLPSIFFAHRVQQSHCLSIFHPVLLTHALTFSASQLVHKKKSQWIYTSMHSAGLELTKLTYTRLEHNLIRHRGDRLQWYVYTLHLSGDTLCKGWKSPPGPLVLHLI